MTQLTQSILSARQFNYGGPELKNAVSAVSRVPETCARRPRVDALDLPIIVISLDLETLLLAKSAMFFVFGSWTAADQSSSARSAAAGHR